MSNLYKYSPGIHDISNEEYHASEGISRSAISELKKSPLHYYEKYLSEEKPEDKGSDALRCGNAVHTLVLQPEIFEREFAVLEKINLRKKENREKKEIFELENSGKIILTEDEFIKAKKIADSILSHSKTQRFLSGKYVVEKSIFWTDEETGLLCKARPDLWNQDLNLICDIKTTADASADSFMFSIKKFDYHIQAAMQVDAVFAVTGQNIDYFTFLVAQNTAPHKPFIYALNKESIEAGRREYKNALKIFKKCFDTKKWDLERETIIEIDLPFYTLNSNPFHTLNEVYQCQI